jgi:CheY-like chemotaxis protein
MGSVGYRSTKVLVVDDNLTDLSMVAKLLQDSGYSVITAMDGDDAIQKTVREQPQCVILDVVLPKQSGFQVCRRLKHMPECYRIPIILLSVKNTPADLHWGIQQGADRYLTKPYRPDELLMNVQSLT